MSEQIKEHKSTGMEYSYFLIQTIFGMLIFFVWSQSLNLFSKTSLDLFWNLFVVMFFSGIIARILAFILLYFLSKRSKGRPPSFYKINFTKNINRISLIWVVAIALCSLIYAFGIQEAIVGYFFPIDNYGLWSMLFSYLFIKIGTQAISWVFLKTRNI